MLFAGERPDWASDGRDWPNRAHSRFVTAAGLTWHVQVMGSGPACLLVHGTGAATHSWRDLAPMLAEHFTVIAPDLPGHGFTQPPLVCQMTLPGMAHALGELTQALGQRPVLGVGHSAGAPILLRMSLNDVAPLAQIVSLNGAILPLGGAMGHAVASSLARVLFLNPIAPRVTAWRIANTNLAERFISESGSKADPEMVKHYRLIASKSSHVAAALGMMASWNLQRLEPELPQLEAGLLLIAGSNDKAIKPDTADRVAKLVKGAQVVHLPGLGHLAHEEAPAGVAELILRFAREGGLLAPSHAA
ncbi:MAG: alpha/beta fold hydrolase BchO [Geminicoccaceae bacterium]